MGVGTGFIVAGVVAAGLAIGHAVIDNDADKAPEAAKTEQALPPAPAAEPATQPAPAPAVAEPVLQAPAKAEPPASQSPAAAPHAQPPAPAAEAAPAHPAPPARAPAKTEAVAPAHQPTCEPEVNLKGGFVVDRRTDADGKCVKTGKIRPLQAIECTDGSPAGWFHRYYKNERREPVFVTPCMPPSSEK